MWRAISLVALVGCGRFDFDARAVPPATDGAVAADGGLAADAGPGIGIGLDGPGSAGPDGASPDGASPDGPPAFVSPCPVNSTAPDPVTVSGQVLGILSNQPVADVVFEVSTAEAAPAIATASSDVDGNFTFELRTDGVPVRPFIKSSKQGLLTDYHQTDVLFDRDTPNLLSFAGSQADLDTAYSAARLTEDPARGTVFLSVPDCAGNFLAGVTVTTSPASRAIYAGSARSPDGSLAATSTSGIVYLLNVPTGSVTITATAAGRTFLPVALTVRPNPDVSSTNAFASP